MNQFSSRVSLDIDAGTIALEHAKLLPVCFWQRVAVYAITRVMQRLERRIG